MWNDDDEWSARPKRTAAEMELVESSAVRRLMRDWKEIQAEPHRTISAVPSESDIFTCDSVHFRFIDFETSFPCSLVRGSRELHHYPGTVPSFNNIQICDMDRSRSN